MTTVLRSLVAALANWRLWTYLGWLDVRLRYRRSVLGPWWITLSMLIFVVSLGVVYSRLLNQPLKEYLPFLLCGYVIWSFISNSVTEGAELFTKEAAQLITEINVPLMIYVNRLLARNFIIFAHNLIVFVVLMVFFAIPLSFVQLQTILGLLIVMMSLFWVVFLAAMMSARYRDIPPMISSVIQIVFFISPIAWTPKLIGEQSIIVKLNPIYYMMDLIRSPLLGHPPQLLSWLVGLSIALIGGTITLSFYKSYHRQIPFWVT